MTTLVAFAAGLLFALGLGLAGMTDPDNVLAFLDLAGAWDPALMLVLAGACGLYMLGAPLVLRRGRPRWAARFALPTRRDIDGRLLVGAALFGVGWGLVGLCPGPALVDLAGLGGDIVLFVAAMLAGMFLFTRVFATSP
ncbi:DUF6691 family protein [Nannocystis pusilla]|uniref:YeeE/YedE family protein n=1 Tax=Nannocystis pusilla TaxID=889268 RepID=A0ABS7TU86_9BACT|nr:YeeE/YedE family protein [Nannocystis pusilla]